jgi:L-ascorbate metabolism protein UlaG (beta-lactamase superfamily)
MPLEIKIFCHVSIRLETGGKVVYFDPWKLDVEPHDADVVFVSHSHYDHCSPEDVARVSKEGTVILAPAETVSELADSSAVIPGAVKELDGITVEAIAAYNIGKEFHPQANGWCGAVVTIGGKRVYYAGDTDLIPEMANLKDIDVALIPVGGTYTLDAKEAAEACKVIGCKHAVPCHWGEVAGDESDAEAFAEAADCPVTVIRPGESKTIAV